MNLKDVEKSLKALDKKAFNFVDVIKVELNNANSSPIIQTSGTNFFALSSDKGVLTAVKSNEVVLRCELFTF